MDQNELESKRKISNAFGLKVIRKLIKKEEQHDWVKNTWKIEKKNKQQDWAKNSWKIKEK